MTFSAGKTRYWKSVPHKKKGKASGKIIDE
jgi:hypothetical protein